MKEAMIIVIAGATGVTAGSVLADDLYEQMTDGSIGYSNTTINVSGARRTLLDDFVVPAGGWVLQDFHWEHIWSGYPPGSGSGLELDFRADAGGAPGLPVATANVNSYSEMGTGVTYFSRQGAESWVTFDDIILPAGIYWFEATIVGPGNNFWMATQTVTGSECWVNYDDLGGLHSGSEIFGMAADLNFRLTGIPATGVLPLLALAGLARPRRRR